MSTAVPPPIPPECLWHWYGLRVRCALAPDEPREILRYLGLAAALATCHPHRAWQIHERAFHLLTDTVETAFLPWHWRVACLDNAHRPLEQLNRIAANGIEHQRLMALSCRLAALAPPPPCAPDTFAPPGAGHV